MSVIQTMVAVISTAITHLVATIVPVILATLSLVEGHVLVCFNTLLSFQLMMYISDINECNTNNGGCDQNCINQPGTYHCTCNAGYTLSSNLHSCIGKSVT